MKARVWESAGDDLGADVRRRPDIPADYADQATE